MIILKTLSIQKCNNLWELEVFFLKKDSIELKKDYESEEVKLESVMKNLNEVKKHMISDFKNYEDIVEYN